MYVNECMNTHNTKIDDDDDLCFTATSIYKVG